MKRPLFRYAALAAFIILFGAAPRASATLVTYFNFNDNDTTSDAPGQQTVTITQNNLTPSFVPGTTTNAVGGDLAGSGVRLTDNNNGKGNGKYFQFTVNTLNLQNLSLSYATQSSVVFTQTLSFSVNGGAFVTVSTMVPSTTGYATMTFDLSAFPGLNNQASVTFQVEMTQPGGLHGEWNQFDNIQLTADPIPEPATLAGGALALAAVGYMQRRRFRRLLSSARRKRT